MTLHDTVAATLTEMGICEAPATVVRTVLIQDGYLVGHKYRFDGGHAIWLVQTNVIDVYDDDGKLLRTVGVERTDVKKAV
jgi:hypothetical protein